MEPNANPVCKLGDRNALCPHYDGCLDHAVDHRWSHWDCSECPHILEKQALMDAPGVKDHNPLYHLPRRVFGEFSHRFD